MVIYCNPSMPDSTAFFRDVIWSSF